MSGKRAPAKRRRRPARRPRRAPSAQARLRRLQHRIYRALEREAEVLLGPPPRAIQAYQRESERDFRRPARPATPAELTAAIRRHDVTFVADFHTFAQAQRTALRLLRECVRPGERWALGLELIPSHHQRALDDFQAGRLGLDAFHRRVRYRDEWGFPWKNYAPLLAWARAHGVRCVALNRPREFVTRDFSPRGGFDGDGGSGRDLHARDQWAAGVITDLIQAEPGLRVLALYGGHHVGRAHLPAQLTQVSRAFRGRPLTSLSVHQNDARLYWKLARAERELHEQVTRLGNGDAYCVFSATPWAQLQSLIGSAEGEDLEDDGDSPRTDYLSLMDAYGAVIAEFLGRPVISFGSLNLRTIEEADFADQTAPELPPGEAALARALVRENERFYLPAQQLAYLASPSPNAAAEYAAIHWLRRQAPRAGGTSFGPSGGREAFYRYALESAFGFLGSLILNPRRKCDLPADHDRRLRALARGAKPAYAGEARARKLARTLLAAGPRAREEALARLSKRASASALPELMAARYLGRALAKNLHPYLLQLPHGSPEFEETVALFLRRRDFAGACAELARRGSATWRPGRLLRAPAPRRASAAPASGKSYAN